MVQSGGVSRETSARKPLACGVSFTQCSIWEYPGTSACMGVSGGSGDSVEPSPRAGPRVTPMSTSLSLPSARRRRGSFLSLATAGFT